MTLAEYADRWLARVERRVKHRTAESYANVLRLHLVPVLGATSLAVLTRAEIRDALFAKLDAGYAPSTVSLMHRVLRTMLNAARDDGLVTDNPAERLARLLPRRRKGPRTQTALSREALDRFLEAARRTHVTLYVLFLVGARTGLRLGELLGLQWADVDLERRLVTVARTIDARRRANLPKGGETAVLPLSRDAAAALAMLRAADPGPCPWVFHGPSGNPWGRTYVQRIMGRACLAAGIARCSPHALRHSFITHLAENGVSPWTLRTLARHKSITTTELYLHLGRASHSAVDRLDSLDAG